MAARSQGEAAGQGHSRLLLAVLLSALRSSLGTTHWIVTEDGKIQQQVDSPLNLKHPHDLVVFMRQEATVNYLKELEKHLVAQKIHIEENEDRDTGLEQRHYKEDSDCIKAKVPLGDLDLYDGTYISLESKDISPEEYIDAKAPLPPDLETPDCTKTMELPFSIHAFQHLRGIQERINLTAPVLSKEDPIFISLSRRLGRSIEEIGHRINAALLKNTSSWVLYNMASFYWRMKNEPYQVVECVIRALHFSPRQHKDIALMNLANVLHRAHFSADAAILVHAALDVSTDFLTSHYTLGNIYAMLGEYNHSVLCYDQALLIRPGFEHAMRRKHAVLCQQKLEQKLEAQHRSLQRTLNELKEYQKQHDNYLRQQELLEKHKVMQDEQLLRNIIHETQMAKETQLGNHQLCRWVNKQQILHCQWDRPVRYTRGDLFDTVEHVQFGEDSSTSSMMPVEMKLVMNMTWSNIQQQFPSSPAGRSVLNIWGKDFSSYNDILWPKRLDCMHTYPTLPTASDLPTYFLPPEYKGFGVRSLLTSSEKQDRDVAGRLPDCSSMLDFRNNEKLYHLVKELENRPDLKSGMPDYYAKQALFSHLSIIEEQVGEVISQAIEKQTAPMWLLLNEAGLYWRAIGNTTSALDCLRQALNLVPEDYMDIPLVNLANLLIHIGLHQDAAALLQKALAINSTEPLTLLSLGNAYLALRNVSAALQVFRTALDRTTRCPECDSNLKLIRCLQFYPFLYNLTSSKCADHCYSSQKDLSAHEHQKYFADPEKIIESSEEAIIEEPSQPSRHSTVDSSPSDLKTVIVAESNSTDEREIPKNLEPDENPSATAEVFENTWPSEKDLLGAFEGAFEVKGHRVDLQGIRVLKKGIQDGVPGSCFGDCEGDDDDDAEWITVQVKRIKKSKTDSAENQDYDGRSGEKSDNYLINEEDDDHYRSAFEITGPKVPSPGPQGKKRDYISLGWPSPDECLKIRRVELTTVASTWLAVSAKNIDITEHIDFATSLQEPAVEPVCNANLPASMHTLDHLHGVASRLSIHYTGESQLKEVLQNLGKEKYPPQSFEQVGTRIAKVLEKNQTSWVISSMAALYWRVRGQGKKAIDCLRQALHYAPHHMKDVPLISLANIFHNAKLWDDAIIVATMAVEIAPHFVVNHFTLANVYVAMEDYEKAMRWYESTLKLQPEFAPAKDRLRTIQCHLLMKKERHSP
ncbi:tetratricopeptide repeat protein 17 isoform X2 [Carcharodon carcharias]|uniref:tetratricopeptide repeat protein 17 isoform X2 n=1 Tax=Carcharodon carcharias TaxID=13397 RepID=UPI001B7E0125|nr:tetratricopeptide repeat protein 17 isoform X2 [Carcharodon carcharias]